MASPTRIEFSASVNQRSATHRTMRLGSGGQVKYGEAWIGTSGR